MITQSSESTNAELAARIETHIDQIIGHLERWSLPEFTSQANMERVIQAGAAINQHDFYTNFRDTYLVKLPPALNAAKDYKGRATAVVIESEKLLEKIVLVGLGNPQHGELVNKAISTEARLNSFRNNIRLNLERVDEDLQSALKFYPWSNVYANWDAIRWAKDVFTPKVYGECGAKSGFQQPIAFFGLYSLTGFLQYFSTLHVDHAEGH